MAIESERISDQGFCPFWVAIEHRARYAFAADFVRGKTVVDCACGDGAGAIRFSTGGAVRVLALDLSATAALLAKESALGRSNVSIAVATGTELPVPSGYADVFISLETLEHIPDDRAFLDEVVRVLRPGGAFVCSTPNRIVTHPGSSIDIRPINRFHVREYALYEFVSLLANRFKSVDLRGQNPQAKVRATICRVIATLLPVRVTARLQQLFKVRRYIRYRSSSAVVRPLESRLDYEYLVAVCREPRRDGCA